MTAGRKKSAGAIRKGLAVAGVAVVAALAAWGAAKMRAGQDLSPRIARIATATLGVPVTVGAVSIDRATGAVLVADVKIANPPGFKNAHAMTIAQVRLNAQALGPEMLVFNEAGIGGLRVMLEVAPEGTNLAALRRNFNAAAAAGEKNENGAVLKTAVRRVEIADALLQPAALLPGAEGPMITLPDMVMRGVGDRQEGVILSGALAQVADHVVRVASQAAGQAGFYDGMTPEALKAMQEQLGLTGGILEHAIGVVKRDLGEFGGGVRKLLDQAAPAAREVPPSPAP